MKERINSIGNYWKKIFGERVYRISIDGGFTCPNRDGSKGKGGCIYCDETGYRPHYVEPDLSVSEQIKKGIDWIKRKTGINKYIAYFQSYTNTYAPVERLRELYYEALSYPDIVGISISTRPDCVGEDVLDIIEEIAKSYHTWLEIGIESISDEHLKWMRRGHTMEDTVDAIKRIKRRKDILLLGHLIFGLHNEDVIKTAYQVSEWGLDGVKMHHLYVVKNTPLANEYTQGKIKVFESPEAYAKVAVKFLEHIPKNIVIHRLAGYVRKEYLIAPLWTSQRNAARNEINRILEEEDTYQGKFWASKKTKSLLSH